MDAGSKLYNRLVADPNFRADKGEIRFFVTQSSSHKSPLTK
jgi:hypothetical protein